MEELITGIVIYNKIYKENDALVAVLTDYGEKVMFKARGILRITSKNSPACQIFTFGEYQLDFKVEGANKILKAGKVISTPKKLFDDYKASISGMIIIDLIDKIMIDKLFNKDLYLILKDALNYLCSKINTENVLIITLFKILKVLGTQINSDQCSSCGSKTDIISLNLGQGGYICNKCNLGRFTIYPKDFLRDFRFLVKANYQDADTFKVKDKYTIHLLELFSLHLEENCGISLNLKNASIIFSNKI